MPSFLRRHLQAVLTIAALASFHIARAQDTMAPESAFRDNTAWTIKTGALTTKVAAQDRGLVTRATLADSITSFNTAHPQVRAPTWFSWGVTHLNWWARAQETENGSRLRSVSAPRISMPDHQAGQRLCARCSQWLGAHPQRVLRGPERGRHLAGRGQARSFEFIVVASDCSVRNARHEPADFSQLTLPKAAQRDANEKDLRDLVALGKQAFEDVGCVACHLVAPSNTAVSSGPDLFFVVGAEPRTREVVEGGEGHRFQVKAGRDRSSIGAHAAEQLAVAESGPRRARPIYPVMQAFAKETFSDTQVDAIADYLATLNAPDGSQSMVKLAASNPKSPAAP